MQRQKSHINIDPDMYRYLLVNYVHIYLIIYLCILNAISSYQYSRSSSARDHYPQIRTIDLVDMELWERLRSRYSFWDISMYSFIYLLAK